MIDVDLAPSSAIALRELVEASHAIGADRSLVLHGGGNTSVKAEVTRVDGGVETALFVKGSGSSLATIDERGFAPLSLARVRALTPERGITQDRLADALRLAQLDTPSPEPSVESLVHAHIPQRFVLHSHADAVLALTDTHDARARAERVLGADVAVVDYATPGVPLGEAVRACLAEREGQALIAIVVLQHGVFAFGDTAADALAAHATVVERAGRGLETQEASAPQAEEGPAALSTLAAAERVAALRRAIADVAGLPVIVGRHAAAPAVAALHDPALATALRRGPVTPDHVTWLGPRPAIAESPADFRDWYVAYLERHGGASDEAMRTAFPRALLDPELGLLTVGRSPAEAQIVTEIMEHAVSVIRRAEALGGYHPADEAHVHELEHWPAQRAKLTRRDPAAPMAGRIVLVTGAASGIGRACAAAFLDRGAAVVGWDVNPAVETTFEGDRWLGQTLDVSDERAQTAAIAHAVERFGGLDVLVPAAGIFPAAEHLVDLDPRLWERTLAINVTSVVTLLRLAGPILEHAVGGGGVCVVASKNVAAPGPGAAAYSASKAALTQVARVAALEWAPLGIRVNIVHPDAVFDTALWTPELLAARAEHYGMSVDEYKRRNLLRAEVTSQKVGELVAAVASDTFACTTGAQIPIDGGNERVI
ncbi:SDR family oxidoreductase [Agrococcus sediminis]|uniref:SDR family oxidoreductase n=1 Tax=Agrococcus TaxID=46352 RepID=UPI0032B23681